MSELEVLEDVLELIEVATTEWLARKALVEEIERSQSERRARRRAALVGLRDKFAQMAEIDAGLTLLRVTPNLRDRDALIARLEVVRRDHAAKLRPR
jgi:hypothetical protein